MNRILDIVKYLKYYYPEPGDDLNVIVEKRKRRTDGSESEMSCSSAVVDLMDLVEKYFKDFQKSVVFKKKFLSVEGVNFEVGTVLPVTKIFNEKVVVDCTSMGYTLLVDVPSNVVEFIEYFPKPLN